MVSGALLARSLFPYEMVGSIGEIALTFWLILFGVNRERWEAKSG
jgi:hypothetical protein